MNNEQRQALQDLLSASNAELLADIADRRTHAEQFGAIEWPRAQEEPMVETSSRQQPAYRTMSAQERAPWELWLQSAIADLRDEVQDSVAAVFADRDALIDKLQREVDALTSRVNKSWWSR